MTEMPVPPSLTYKFNAEALPLHTDEAGGGGRWEVVGAKQGRQDVEVPD